MTHILFPATVGRRLAASLYDGLLLLALWMSTFLVTTLTSEAIGWERPQEFDTALLFLVAFGFYGWFWTHGGQTLGGRAWGLQVQRLDGGPLNWPTAMLRFAFSLTWLPLGAIWAASSGDRRALHDLASGTRVIHLPKTDG